MKKVAAQTKKKHKSEAPAKKRRSERILEKKPYLELITAALSIPVLLTIIILNFNNLKGLNGKEIPTPTPEEKIIYTNPVVTNTNCKKQLGPIEIISPEEGDNVTENPVAISITYDDKTYCTAVWSYRVNGGDWSDYDNNSISLYNPPSGDITFELRIKSLASNEEKTIIRKFSYKGKSTVPTPPPAEPTTSSPSAN